MEINVNLIYRLLPLDDELLLDDDELLDELPPLPLEYDPLDELREGEL